MSHFLVPTLARGASQTTLPRRPWERGKAKIRDLVGWVEALRNPPLPSGTTKYESVGYGCATTPPTNHSKAGAAMNSVIRIAVVATTVVTLMLRVELVRADGKEEPVKPVMVLSGQDSSADKHAFARCSSMNDLKQQWRTHCNLPADDECTKCPVIDFDSYEMVMLFEGKTDPNSGFQIASISDNGNRIRIRFKIAFYQTAVNDTPTEAEGVPTLKPQKSEFRPYSFILLRASKKLIVIEEDTCLTRGAPPDWEKVAELPVGKGK